MSDFKLESVACPLYVTVRMRIQGAVSVRVFQTAVNEE